MKATTLLKSPLETDLSEFDTDKLTTLSRDLVRTGLREQAKHKEDNGDDAGALPVARGKLYLEALATIGGRDQDLAAVAFTCLQREGFDIATILHAAQAYKDDESAGDDHPVHVWMRHLKSGTVDNADGRQEYVDGIEARARDFITA